MVFHNFFVLFRWIWRYWTWRSKYHGCAVNMGIVIWFRVSVNHNSSLSQQRGIHLPISNAVECMSCLFYELETFCWNSLETWDSLFWIFLCLVFGRFLCDLNSIFELFYSHYSNGRVWAHSSRFISIIFTGTSKKYCMKFSKVY